MSDTHSTESNPKIAMLSRSGRTTELFIGVYYHRLIMSAASRGLRTVVRHPATLLLAVLAAWSSTLPIGVGPDSEFHLASTWCAAGIREGQCESGSEALTRRVPAEVVGQCPLMLATSVCLQMTRLSQPSEMRETTWVNTSGTYVDAYYWINSLLVTDNVEWSVVAIRMLGVALFVAVFAVALSVATARIRRSLVIAIGVTAPSYLWLVSLVTGQSWTTTGLAGYWLFALVAGESVDWSDRRRRTAVAGMVGCAALVAASRTDGVALLFVSTAICAVIALERRSVSLGRQMLVACGTALVGFVVLRFVLSPSYFRYFLAVFAGEHDLLSKYNFTSAELMFHNIHHSAEFVMASLAGQHQTVGDPTIVGPTVYLVSFALGGLAFLVSGRPTRQFWIALAGVTVALVVYPVLAALRNGETMIQEFIPRYLAPFAIPAVGLLLIHAPGVARLDTMSSSVRRLLVGIIAVSHASALHLAMRFAVSGDNLGVSSWNLNKWVLWWWSIGPSPMTMWMLGSVALPMLVNAQLKETIDA